MLLSSVATIIARQRLRYDCRRPRVSPAATIRYLSAGTCPAHNTVSVCRKQQPRGNLLGSVTISSRLRRQWNLLVYVVNRARRGTPAARAARDRPPNRRFSPVMPGTDKVHETRMARSRSMQERDPA